MRVPALLAACLIAGPALAQPYDPVTAAQNQAAIAAQDQAAVAADNARRAAADVQREAEVARQRLETEQRIQSLEAQQSDRRAAAARADAEPLPPPASSARIVPGFNALQTHKAGVKPGRQTQSRWERSCDSTT